MIQQELDCTLAAEQEKNIIDYPFHQMGILSATKTLPRELFVHIVAEYLITDAREYSKLKELFVSGGAADWKTNCFLTQTQDQCSEIISLAQSNRQRRNPCSASAARYTKQFTPLYAYITAPENATLEAKHAYLINLYKL